MISFYLLGWFICLLAILSWTLTEPLQLSGVLFQKSILLLHILSCQVYLSWSTWTFISVFSIFKKNILCSVRVPPPCSMAWTLSRHWVGPTIRLSSVIYHLSVIIVLQYLIFYVLKKFFWCIFHGFTLFHMVDVTISWL